MSNKEGSLKPRPLSNIEGECDRDFALTFKPKKCGANLQRLLVAKIRKQGERQTRLSETDHMAMGQAAGKLSEVWLLKRISRDLDRIKELIAVLETDEGKQCASPGGCPAASRLQGIWLSLFPRKHMEKPKVEPKRPPQLTMEQFLNGEG